MIPEGGRWGLLRALQRPAVKAACPSTSSPTAWESQWSTDLLGLGLWELGLSPGSWVVAGHFPVLDGPIQSPQGARVQCLPSRVTFLIKAFHRILSSFQTTQLWRKWEETWWCWKQTGLDTHCRVTCSGHSFSGFPGQGLPFLCCPLSLHPEGPSSACPRSLSRKLFCSVHYWTLKTFA